MPRIFLNADDFGLTAGVNAAVFDLAARGVLASTTVMNNMPFAGEAAKLVSFPGFGIGLHVNLTEGRPLSAPQSVPTLVGSDGEFLGQKAFRARERSGKIRKTDILREIEAQFGALRALVGARLTHLDSHQNVHKARTVARAFIAFGGKHPGLGCRAPVRYLLLTPPKVDVSGHRDRRLKPTVLQKTGAKGTSASDDESSSREERRASAAESSAQEERRALAADHDTNRDRLKAGLQPEPTLSTAAKARGSFCQPSVAEFGGAGFRIQPAWRYHLLRGQFRRALTELYLLHLTRRLRTVFWTPNGELYPPSLKKLELLETLRGWRMADGGWRMADHKSEIEKPPSAPCPWSSAIRHPPSAIYEIACHPAVDAVGLGESALTEKRVREYEVLMADGE